MHRKILDGLQVRLPVHGTFNNAGRCTADDLSVGYFEVTTLTAASTGVSEENGLADDSFSEAEAEKC